MKLDQLDQECQEAFNKLKELGTTAPILAYADFGNHSNYILTQVFSALELFYTKNKMELKRLLVMPVDHYQNWNPNIPSIKWNFST